MIHVDVKKVGRIPDGGGWRAHGRGNGQTKAVDRGKKKTERGDCVYPHSAVDRYSRLPYTEALPDEKTTRAIAFLHRAGAWLPAHGITWIERIVTDNGACYRAESFSRALLGARHQRIAPYTPRHNGKVERYNRIRAEEFLYARTWTSEDQRAQLLGRWNVHCNYYRPHTRSEANHLQYDYQAALPTSWPPTRPLPRPIDVLACPRSANGYRSLIPGASRAVFCGGVVTPGRYGSAMAAHTSSPNGLASVRVHLPGRGEGYRGGSGGETDLAASTPSGEMAATAARPACHLRCLDRQPPASPRPRPGPWRGVSAQGRRHAFVFRDRLRRLVPLVAHPGLAGSAGRRTRPGPLGGERNEPPPGGRETPAVGRRLWLRWGKGRTA